MAPGYKASNWPAYNEALKQRGFLMSDAVDLEDDLVEMPPVGWPWPVTSDLSGDLSSAALTIEPFNRMNQPAREGDDPPPFIAPTGAAADLRADHRRILG